MTESKMPHKKASKSDHESSRKEKPMPPGIAATSSIDSGHGEEIAKDLSGIYAGDDADERRDMTRLDQADHSVMKRVLIGVIAFCSVLAAVSWAGFFMFSPGRERFVGERVSVTIEGPAEVKSGEAVKYAIRWKNDERVPIGTASLELRLPKSFTLTKAEPAQQDDRWLIGAITPGSDGMVRVEGVYLAPIDKEMDVQGILTYRPADFNSEFQKVETKTIKVTGSAVDLTVNGPAKILPGDKIILTLDCTNSSANAFKDVRVRGAWPDTFIPDGAEPAALGERFQEWKIDELPANGKATIKVTGTFASSTEGPIDIKARVGFLGEDEAFELQKEATLSTTVLRGDLITALILNGKSGDQPARFGDRLRYAVSYKNTGTATLEDVTIAATIAPSVEGLVDWNKLADRAKGTRDGNVITWTKKQIPSLEKIGGSEEGTLDFEVPLVAAPVGESKDFSVTSSLEVTVRRIDGAEVGRVAKTQPIVAKLVSDTDLTAEARYFTDDNVPVGSGPLPPEVGKDTAYRITWRIDNSLHDLADLRLSAKLPANVEWTGLSSVDAGELRFDSASEKMIWKLNWMPVNVRTLAISFDVKLTPNEGDHGRIPTLVDAAIFEATDKTTGYPLLLSAPPLSTSLDSDQFASGKGRVR